MLVDSTVLLIIYYKCGLTLNRKARNATGVFPSPHGSSPWHASIYKIQQGGAGKSRLICGGTILTDSHIVTAAQCVFINDCTQVDPKPFRVVVGQTHQEGDPDAQSREVSVAKVHSDYSGEIAGYASNLAVLYLDEPLFITDYVMPVCIIRDKKASRHLPNILEASGWSIDTSQTFAASLKEGAFGTEDNFTCRRNNRQRLKYINFDKFCIQTPQGELKEDIGTGLVQRISNRYYLKGVISEALDKHFSLATYIFLHQEWLKTTMIRIEEEKKCEGKFACQRGLCIDAEKKCNGIDDCPDGYDEEDCSSECVGIVKIELPKTKATTKCVTPSQLGGAVYNLVGCQGNGCAKSAGFELENGDQIRLVCGRGTAPSVLHDPVYICSKGSWFPTHPLCEKLCTLKTKSNLKTVKCERERTHFNCTQYVRPGTVVTYECDHLYKVKNPVAFMKITCLEGGRWSDNAPDCTPECGIKNHINAYVPTISYGTNATYGEYPWHVAVYGRPDTRYENWTYRCGGTILLYANIILTAAHCVYWDEFATRLMVADQIMIAGGKILRTLHEKESFQQTANVNKIVPHKGFTGRRGQSGLGNDIALVILKVPFKVTDFVLPCCLGATFTASFIPNLNGTVVGWGFVEKGLKNWGKTGILSDHLLYTQLPLVSNQECQTLDSKAKYVTAPDKFCGLYRNESGPQRGDSGGGLVVPMGDLYYVVGVVSSKPNDSYVYGTFTSVGSHKPWLVENILANEIVN